MKSFCLFYAAMTEVNKYDSVTLEIATANEVDGIDSIAGLGESRVVPSFHTISCLPEGRIL